MNNINPQTLLYVAHPDLSNSHFSAGILKCIDSNKITLNNIATKIHNRTLNVKEELNLANNFNKLIFLFPIFWYAPPFTLAYWLEKVLVPEDSLDPAIIFKNKSVQFIVSTGSEEGEYSTTGKHKNTVDEFLNSLIMSFDYYKADIKTSKIFYATWKLSTQELLKIAHEIT